MPWGAAMHITDMMHGQVVSVETVQGQDASWMLQVVAALERTSAHPVAAAIVGHAAALGLDLSLQVTDSHDAAGGSVCAGSCLS